LLIFVVAFRRAKETSGSETEEQKFCVKMVMDILFSVKGLDLYFWKKLHFHELFWCAFS
jgi:hypothetical protein